MAQFKSHWILSIIDLALFRLTGRKELLDEAWNVALRVAGMLGVDERSGARVFLPGALDHRNAANHAIDSGAAADCLASVILEAGDAHPADERARLEEAVRPSWGQQEEPSWLLPSALPWPLLCLLPS